MEISIAQACIYKDGRCHGVFSDGSALIFHRGGQYCTYFSQTGEISRQVTACTVAGTKAKVLKLIKLYNPYCFFPICTFAEEIYKVLSKETKVLSGTFQVPGQVTVVCKSELVRIVQYTP